MERGSGLKKTNAMVFTALMSAVLCVLSLISIPLPSGIPFTFQTFAVSLCGYLLGIKFGLISLLVYLALGAVGLPVFSHAQGGLQVLIGGPTGGFLFGFIPLVLLCGISLFFAWKFIPPIFGIIGLILCNLCGVLQYAYITQTPLYVAFCTVSLPFIFKDAFLVIGAYLVSVAIKKTINIK